MAIRSPAGQLLAVVDAWWDDVGLAWQIDSREFHLAPADYDATLRRHSALAAAGILVVHTLPTRLRDDAKAVLNELTAAHARAAGNHRPNVTATPWGKPGMWASLAPS